MTYNNYLKSSHWKNIKEAFFKKKRLRCIICHSYKKLNLHHINYKNLGFEAEKDLKCLCQNCHTKIHKYHLEKFISKHKILRKFFKNLKRK